MWRHPNNLCCVSINGLGPLVYVRVKMYIIIDLRQTLVPM